ncbi:MAG: universal stress protein [Desulfofundulus sp.]
MYNKVLVAYDGSPYSKRALSAGIELARGSGSELHAAAVVNLPDYAGTVAEVDDMVTRAREFFEKKMADAVSRAAAKNVKLTTHLIFGHVGETLVRFARENNFDLIVVGTHGWSTIKKLVMGSVSSYVIHHATCDVLVAKGREE